nr:dirigent protein 5 [Tanacetum cinerariifolium]
MYPPVARVASLTELNLGGRAADRLNTRDKTRNLSLKEIKDTKGPVPIRFEVRDKQALMPHGEHAAHWSSYIRKVIRGVPLYHPSWLKVPKERKAMFIADIRAKSTVISRQGSRSLARLRDEMRQSSATREYPSLIDTFFVAHTINGEFLLDEDRRIYEEMRRLEAMSTYTADEINRLAKGGKQRGHIPGVGK